MKKLIFLSIILAVAFSIRMNLKDRYQMKKLTRTKSRNEQFSYWRALTFLKKGVGKATIQPDPDQVETNTILNEVYLEALGIVAEPKIITEGVSSEGFTGTKGVSMKSAKESLRLAMKSYAEAAVILTDKPLVQAKKEEMEKYKKKSEEYYDDPTTRQDPNDPKKQISYGQGSVILPYRLMTNCFPNSEIAIEMKYPYPIRELSKDEQNFIVTQGSTQFALKGNQDQKDKKVKEKLPENELLKESIIVEQGLNFQVIDTLQLSGAETNDFATYNILFFINPLAKRVVTSGKPTSNVKDANEQVNKFFKKNCESQFKLLKQSITAIKNSYGALEIINRFQESFIILKKKLNDLAKKLLKDVENLSQFFISGGQSPEKLQNLKDGLKFFGSQASDLGNLDPTAIIKKYDLSEDASTNLLKELVKNLGEPQKRLTYLKCLEIKDKKFENELAGCADKEIKEADVKAKVLKDFGVDIVNLEKQLESIKKADLYKKASL